MTKRIGYAMRIALIAAVVMVAHVPFFSNSPVLAQDETPEPVAIAGSLYLEGLVQQLVEDYQAASGDDTDFVFDAGGNNTGFEALCSGEADLVMTTRDISDEEILNCDENGIEFVETLLAVEGLVLVPSVAVTESVTCVVASNLPDILGAGAPETLNWTQISPLATISGQVTLHGPGQDSAAVALLTALLPDNLPRTDYEVFESIDDVLDVLADPLSNALAFTTFAEWNALEDKGDVTAFNVGAEDLSNCIAPAGATIAAGDYALGRRLLLYVDASSIDNSAVNSLLTYAYLDEGAATAAAGFGFTAIDEDSAARSVLNVTDLRTGRTFTRANTPVELNTAQTGELTIQGAGLTEPISDVVFTNFSETFPAITLQRTPLGNAAGWQALCSGEVGVIEVTRPATNDERAVCDQNGINPKSVQLGGDAVVLLVDGSNEDLPTCLAYEDVRTLLERQNFDPQNDQTVDAEADGENDSTDPQGPTNWSAVSDLDLPLLILPSAERPNQDDLPLEIATLETDVIFSVVAPGEAVLPRNDEPTVQPTPEDTDLDDIVYRLGAITNYAEGEALAYMLWSEWVANQEGTGDIRAMSIGPDCVAPTAETVASGDYPFSINSYLVFSEAALGDPVAAALLWQTYTDDVLDLLQERGLAGFSRDEFVSQRDALFNLIADAQAAAAEAEAMAEEETSTGNDEAQTDTTEGGENSNAGDPTPDNADGNNE